MNNKTITYYENDYDPLNRGIDESIRTQRSRTAWRYAKVTSLILVSIGILAVLLAWAYSIYKKPNPEVLAKLEKVEKIIYQEKEAGKKIDQDSQRIINGERVVYNDSTTRFFTKTIDGYFIVTGWKYTTVKNLLEGKKPSEKYCYIEKNQVKYTYDRPVNIVQKKRLQEMGLNSTSVLKYKAYCNYN
tara:strand:- start:364 stop:924 length:561 start_codon:yes stop_codon:yes gene_type:complete